MDRISDNSDKEIHIDDSRKDTRYFVAVAWGALMGCLTLAAGPLAVGSPNSIIDATKFTLTMLLIPGLLCAALIGSLVPGMVVNGLIHLGVSWLILTLFARFRRRT